MITATLSDWLYENTSWMNSCKSTHKTPHVCITSCHIHYLWHRSYLHLHIHMLAYWWLQKRSLCIEKTLCARVNQKVICRICTFMYRQLFIQPWIFLFSPTHTYVDIIIMWIEIRFNLFLEKFKYSLLCQLFSNQCYVFTFIDIVNNVSMAKGLITNS